MSLAPDVRAALERVERGDAVEEIETDTLDCKVAPVDLKKAMKLLAEAAICFANARGGVLVVGVDDKATGPEAFAGCDLEPQEVQREILHHAPVTTPKIRTKTIGIRLAKAIRPKPSIIGLRPLMALASPTPRAVTSGTVIVEVVTPPLS